MLSTIPRWQIANFFTWTGPKSQAGKKIFGDSISMVINALCEEIRDNRKHLPGIDFHDPNEAIGLLAQSGEIPDAQIQRIIVPVYKRLVCYQNFVLMREAIQNDRDFDKKRFAEIALANVKTLSSDGGALRQIKLLGDIVAVCDAKNDAEQIYRVVIEKSKDRGLLAATYGNLAVLEFDSGRGAQALEHDRKRVELDPTSADAVIVLASHLDKSGDYQGARTQYERFLMLESEGARATYVKKMLEEQRFENAGDKAQ